MTTITANGAYGALLALPNVQAELHGVSAKRFGSGKIVANGRGYGETSMTNYYFNGRKISRFKALCILNVHIGKDDPVTIEGPSLY